MRNQMHDVAQTGKSQNHQLQRKKKGGHFARRAHVFGCKRHTISASSTCLCAVGFPSVFLRLCGPEEVVWAFRRRGEKRIWTDARWSPVPYLQTRIRPSSVLAPSSKARSP